MAQCPVCQAEITADFGLVECDSCQAQLIVHVDGTVEASSGPVGLGNETGYLEDADDLVQPSAEDGGSPEHEQMQENAEYGAEFEPSGIRTSSAGRPVDDAAEMEFSSGESGQFDSNPPSSVDAFAEIEGGPEPEVYRSPATSSSPDLSDIAEFGNSDISSHREGVLRYNLHVSGIDTVDIREAFRESLTDRKFVWDIDRILRSVRNGEVVISDVSAVKAYMLISRLRGLPVRVRWEQYAIHQA